MANALHTHLSWTKAFLQARLMSTMEDVKAMMHLPVGGCRRFAVSGRDTVYTIVV